MSSENILLHALYLLQKVARENPTAKELALLFSATCSAICQVIKTIGLLHVSDMPKIAKTRHNTTKAQCGATEVDEEIQKKLSSIELIFPLLLERMEPLGVNSSGKAFQGQLVYSCIEVFRDSLERICLLSIACNNSRHQQAQKVKNTRGQLPSTLPSFSVGEENTTMRLCRLVVVMAVSLDISKPTHNDVFEGFLYFLLDHVGRLLKVLVFGDEDDGQQPETTSNSVTLSSTSTFETNPKDTVAQENQAPYLIWILEQILTLTASHSIKPSALGQPVGKRPAHLAAKFDISEKARNKLQETLLKAIFGSEATEFVNSLKKPCPPGIDLRTPLVVKKVEDVRDWYKQEVWRLVGWEVLEQHIQWDGIGSDG